MSLQAIYETFLASPKSLNLTQNATLSYITTLTTLTKAEEIVEHLDSQNKLVVKKKAEKIIGAVEGQTSLSLEIETTLEFISGGGAYLPRLENFVTDKSATFPIVHTVHFDKDQHIQHIRVFWDQASLLKQVDIIGSRGNSWPICDGRDQARLISSASSSPANTEPTQLMTRGREMDEIPAMSRSESPNKKHIKDPHSSLDLFEPSKPDANRNRSQSGVAVRDSIKPPQRELFDISAGHGEYEPGRSRSPERKEDRQSTLAVKGGAGQRYQPSRLFDEAPDPDSPVMYKSNPAKYNHFSLGDEPEKDPFQHDTSQKIEESEAVPLRAKTNKHGSQWDFVDFVTPEKVHQKVRGQDVRHFGWSEDEGENVETPGKHPKVVQPRPDSEAHFEFQDDGIDKGRPAGSAKPAHAYNGHGLYSNNVYEDGMHTGDAQPETRPLKGTTNHVSMYDGTLYTGSEDQDNQPLKNVTNNIGRQNDFNNHWTMADSSPMAPAKTNKENRLAAQWDTYDDSPEPAKKPTDARGLRKGQESHWGFDNENSKPTPTGTKKEERNFWDF